jgi:hypothetical protein
MSQSLNVKFLDGFKSIRLLTSTGHRCKKGKYLCEGYKLPKEAVNMPSQQHHDEVDSISSPTDRFIQDRNRTSEREKMLRGDYYLPYEPGLVTDRERCAAAIWRFNNSIKTQLSDQIAISQIPAPSELAITLSSALA